MSYEQARQEALYLTDKMAYELNLNDQQYNDAYEINLDYLLSLNAESDLYEDYLSYRLSDLRHILYDWQYNSFVPYIGDLEAGTLASIIIIIMGTSITATLPFITVIVVDTDEFITIMDSMSIGVLHGMEVYAEISQ